MGWLIIILLALSIGLMALTVRLQEGGLFFGFLSFFGLAITVLLFLIWFFRKIINKHTKSKDKNRKKQGNIELILLGIGCIMFIYAGLFYRYVTIVGIFTTLVGCYLWARRKNSSWAFMFWDILGPMLILLGIGFIMFFYNGLFYPYMPIVGICTTLVGCYLWTRRKKRSWAFMFWGILGPLGFLGIALLEDKTITNNTAQASSK